MLSMSVTLPVSNDERSSDVKALQLQNMQPMYLTFAVSNDETSKVVRALQL